MDVKEFLYGWSGRRKIIPNYEVKSIGTKHKQKFSCECRLMGFDFVGNGSATSKRDAMSNAAREVVQFLIETKVLEASQVPSSVLQQPNQTQEASTSESELSATTGAIKAAPSKRTHSNQDNLQGDYNKKIIQKVEEADFLADLHGGWTFETAKSRLHQFLQVNRIKADYKFSCIGPEHSRNFVAEMDFYVPQARKAVSAMEQGTNKTTSSKACALSLIRQLFHLKLVEGFTEVKRSKKTELPPFRVELNHSSQLEVNHLLQCYGIKHQDFNPSYCSKDNPISLLCRADDYLLDGSLANWGNKKGGVVKWGPPSHNFNPWASSVVVQKGSMEEINADLLKSFRSKQNDASYKKTQEERKNLPIFQMKDKILEVIKSSPVVLIRGDTGSGKTTQVPQFILDDFIQRGVGGQCSIVVTQPRRISAVSISERVSDERCENLGSSTGYSVRFESVLPRSHGSILYCTVGTMLRKLEMGLNGISHIIVDEIHERDINTDFLLIILRDMVAAYSNLKVILMSATVDTAAFQKYFGGCPVVEVTGRVHPVKEYFLEDVIEMLKFTPSPTDKKKRDDDDDFYKDEKEENCNLQIGNEYSESTRRAMSQMSERDHSFEIVEMLIGYISKLEIEGAILIFLSGWNIIFSLYKHLLRNPLLGSSKYLILPLHSQIPREDQKKVFYPPPRGVTKVILATNIAESSITINDVVFVVDFCKIKTKMFTSHNNMTNYTTMWCSRTNLEQRKGRAGRVRSGHCYYLCSKMRYSRMDEYSCPEMLRSPLHEVSLSIKLLGLGDIGQFLSKALETPPIHAMVEAEALLREMKALNKKSNLTTLGRMLAKLPIEPRLGKMIIYGCIFGCADAACTVAASTTFTEPFQLSMDKRRLEWIHKDLSGDRHSDHCALLNAFQSWSDAKVLGDYQEYKFCESQSLSLSILRTTNEAKKQISGILKNAGFPDDCFRQVKYHFRGEDSNLDSLLTLLGLGFYPNVCYHKEKRKLLTSDLRPALVHKSSVNCSNMDVHFPFPFFIFTEKIRSGAVACKQMTMVTPIQLLMFASRSVKYDSEAVVLDNWIKLQMDPIIASQILALRPALENLVTKATSDPDIIDRLDPLDQRLIQLVRDLSSPRVASFGFESSDGEPPSKRQCFEGGESSFHGQNNWNHNHNHRGSHGQRCFTASHQSNNYMHPGYINHFPSAPMSALNTVVAPPKEAYGATSFSTKPNMIDNSEKFKSYTNPQHSLAEVSANEIYESPKDSSQLAAPPLSPPCFQIVREDQNMKNDCSNTYDNYNSNVNDSRTNMYTNELSSTTIGQDQMHEDYIPLDPPRTGGVTIHQGSPQTSPKLEATENMIKEEIVSPVAHKSHLLNFRLRSMAPDQRPSMDQNNAYSNYNLMRYHNKLRMPGPVQGEMSPHYGPPNPPN